jgi:photosystem II stability/assembly factor-like uncharacterized protein
MIHRLTKYLLIIAWLLAACQTGPVGLETVSPTDLPAAASPSGMGTEPVITSEVTQEVSPAPATQPPVPPQDDDQVLWAYTETDVLQSRDGGQSWQDVTPSGLREGLTAAGQDFVATFKADFSGDDFGLAAFTQTDHALIYRTQDGGRTWEESVLVLEEDIQGIVALDTLGEQLGWLLVTRGLGAGNEWVDLYHTQDGGTSWSYLAWSSTEADPYGSIPSGGIKSGISFSDPQRGWITGSAPIEGVYLFRSLDGGQTWQADDLPLPEGVAVSGNSSAPIFFDAQLGVLAVGVYTITDAPGLVFFWTQDGGDSWLPSPVLEGRFTAWDWVDAQKGFVSEANDYNQSRLFTTQDGGATWEAFPIQLEAVNKMDFFSAQVGSAICGWKTAPKQGCAGDLYRTLDGGLSWEKAVP